MIVIAGSSVNMYISRIMILAENWDITMSSSGGNVCIISPFSPSICISCKASISNLYVNLTHEVSWIVVVNIDECF